jgi:hypothetical protein
LVTWLYGLSRLIDIDKEGVVDELGVSLFEPFKLIVGLLRILIIIPFEFLKVMGLCSRGIDSFNVFLLLL